MELRTDLAVEYTEPTTHKTERHDDCLVTRIREKGVNYVTLEVPAISDHLDGSSSLLNLLRDELAAFLPEDGLVLVAGLGNRNSTPDSLGPACTEKILATRHVRRELARVTENADVRPVAVTCPGVLGCTGVESSETLHALVLELNPSAVITIDAIAAREVSRLGCVIQISGGGVAPGSGIGNNRPPLNRQTLGVPVIGIGIPTVVDAATLVYDLTGKQFPKEEIGPNGASMLVTPTEIDILISRAALLISMAINLSLNPSFSAEEFRMLT